MLANEISLVVPKSFNLRISYAFSASCERLCSSYVFALSSHCVLFIADARHFPRLALALRSRLRLKLQPAMVAQHGPLSWLTPRARPTRDLFFEFPETSTSKREQLPPNRHKIQPWFASTLIMLQQVTSRTFGKSEECMLHRLCNRTDHHELSPS